MLFYFFGKKSHISHRPKLETDDVSSNKQLQFKPFQAFVAETYPVRQIFIATPFVLP